MSKKVDDITKTKDWRVLEFVMPIEEKVKEGADFLIKGVAINETTTLNNVKYISEELEKAAPSFRNVPILLDHRNEIRNIVGRTTEGVVFNSAFRRIDFEGKIMDKNIQEMIKDGRIQSVSIGAKVEDLIEEEDGSMRAVGIKGLEISLVAVPGDTQANLAQAIEQGIILKEKAKIDEEVFKEDIRGLKKEIKEELKEELFDLSKSNKEVNQMEKKIKEQEEESKDEAEVVEEPKAEAVEEPKEEVVVDNSAVVEMRKEIEELKTLLVTRKKLKEQVEAEEPAVEKPAVEEPKEEVADETKGEVSDEEEVAKESADGVIIERAGGSKFALYRDYSKESSDSKLKRLVR